MESPLTHTRPFFFKVNENGILERVVEIWGLTLDSLMIFSIRFYSINSYILEYNPEYIRSLPKGALEKFSQHTDEFSEGMVRIQFLMDACLKMFDFYYSIRIENPKELVFKFAQREVSGRDANVILETTKDVAWPFA